MHKNQTEQQLSPQEIDILSIFIFLPPPVSLDVLVELKNYSPVFLLHTLDNLINKGWVYNYEPSKLGYYVLSDPGKASTILNWLSPKKISVFSEQLINFVENSNQSEDLKNLSIANISYYSGSCFKPKCVLAAADYCQKIGATEAATAYYLIILNRFESSDHLESYDNQIMYIDATLGIVSAHGHRTPLDHQRFFLSNAMDLAKVMDDQVRLCKLKLHLAQVAKEEGCYEEAEKLNNEAWKLAQKLNEDGLLRQAALFTSDFLFWQGRISEAIKRYEEVIGDLEEFPPDASTLMGCATLGWCYGISGQIARGISLIDAARNKAKDHNFFHVIRYADIMSVLTLFCANRIEEAEFYLNHFFETPEKDLGNYELWAGYASKALVLHSKGDFEGCFKYQTKAYEKSKALGWVHHRGPWNFDYMETLEERGLIHPEMNYNSEIQRLRNWPDIYMKGVSLRYHAKRMFKNGSTIATIFPFIDESIQLLNKSGARIELSHAQVLKAKICLQIGEEDNARQLLNEAWGVLSGINPKLFPEELLSLVEGKQTEDSFLDILLGVVDAIGTVRGHRKLLKQIINLLLKLTKAGRGGIFLNSETNELNLMASRNIDITYLESEEFSHSYQLVKEAFKKGHQFYLEGNFEEQQESPKKGTAWTVVYPIKHQNLIKGVIYLDNNLFWAKPPKECLFVIKIIVNLVAIALENAEAYKEIAKLKEKLEDETRFYREEFDSMPYDADIIGKTKGIKTVLTQINKVAPTDTAVLIQGETGVGKELVAKAIHRLSNRKNGPFIPVNCAALDPGLIASELFGHEKGAFTGASRIRKGRFELSDGGTLFLDDIDALSLEIQAKILRALQEKEFERLGADKTTRSAFRLLAATNQNLEEMIEKGLFRQDLYFRLKVFPIHVPPLRERKEDIPLLALYFLSIFNQKFGKNINGLKNSQIEKLTEYGWPGNIRELEHVMERAVILSDGKNIELPELHRTESSETENMNYKILPMKEMEREYILRALKTSKWKVSGKGGAAEKLEMKPTTLYARIRKHGIEKNYSL